MVVPRAVLGTPPAPRPPQWTNGSDGLPNFLIFPPLSKQITAMQTCICSIQVYQRCALSCWRTGAQLHIDGWATNFWMGQLLGRKRWTFFSAEAGEDVLNTYLYRNNYTSRIVYEGNLTKHPLAGKLRPVQAITEPGDLIFIPQGT